MATPNVMTVTAKEREAVLMVIRMVISSSLSQHIDYSLTNALKDFAWKLDKMYCSE